MKKILLSIPLLILQAPIAFAQTISSGDGIVTTTTTTTTTVDPSLIVTVIPVTRGTVPEISALEGTAALAIVAAVMLLAWERRRRAG